jgi:phage gp16-like protein
MATTKQTQAAKRSNRQQLYDLARKKGIPGRSKMGKSELIEAVRRAG